MIFLILFLFLSNLYSFEVKFTFAEENRTLLELSKEEEGFKYEYYYIYGNTSFREAGLKISFSLEHLKILEKTLIDIKERAFLRDGLNSYFAFLDGKRVDVKIVRYPENFKYAFYVEFKTFGNSKDIIYKLLNEEKRFYNFTLSSLNFILKKPQSLYKLRDEVENKIETFMYGIKPKPSLFSSYKVAVMTVIVSPIFFDFKVVLNFKERKGNLNLIGFEMEYIFERDIKKLNIANLRFKKLSKGLNSYNFKLSPILFLALLKREEPIELLYGERGEKFLLPSYILVRLLNKIKIFSLC